MVTIKSKNVNAYNSVSIQADGQLGANDKSFQQSKVKVVSDSGTAAGSPGYVTEGVKGPR